VSATETTENTTPTTTTTEAEADKLTPKGSKAFKQFAPLFETGAKALRGAESQVLTATLDLGRLAIRAQASMLDAGVTAGETTRRIVAALAAGGKVVQWSTVESWTKAVQVADSLPESIRGEFNTYGLISLRGVGGDEGDKLAERVAFAESLVKSGDTSDHNVRAKVKAHKGSSGGSGKSEADIAKAVLTALADNAGIATLAKRIKSGKVEGENAVRSIIVTAFMLGVEYGSGKEPTRGVRNGIEELLTPKSS